MTFPMLLPLPAGRGLGGVSSLSPSSLLAEVRGAAPGAGGSSLVLPRFAALRLRASETAWLRSGYRNSVQLIAEARSCFGPAPNFGGS